MYGHTAGIISETTFRSADIGWRLVACVHIAFHQDPCNDSEVIRRMQENRCIDITNLCFVLNKGNQLKFALRQIALLVPCEAHKALVHI
jgi:hypothetical protein